MNYNEMQWYFVRIAESGWDRMYGRPEYRIRGVPGSLFSVRIEIGSPFHPCSLGYRMQRKSYA